MFPATMSEQNDETGEIQSSDEGWNAEYRRLLLDFPTLAAVAETYEGPVSGLFRATDLAQFPTRVQPAFQVLGRAFWVQVRALVGEVLGEVRERTVPLEEILDALLQELRLAEGQLVSAYRGHESVGLAGTDPEMEAEAQHVLEVLRGLIRRSEAFALGRQVREEVTGAR